MTYEELKNYCDKEIQKYPQYLLAYKREMLAAKRFYDNGRNLHKELLEKKDKIDKRYIIPFLLGITNEVIDKKPNLIQVKNGSFSLPDIDTDWSSEGKAKIQNHLKEKYGADCFAHVGTYSIMGPASAASDLLRIYNVDFKVSKLFTSFLQKDLTWEENIKVIQETSPAQYQFYTEHKTVLDLVPYFIGKIRQCLPHYQLVDTSSGKKKIEDLNKQDAILYLRSNGDLSYTKNYELIKSGKKKVFEITLESGKKIRTSDEHILFTVDGMKKMKDLKIGDKLMVKQ